MPVRVAIDAMGGDHAPAATVEGALRASRVVDVLLVGRKSELESELERHPPSPRIEVVNASDVIEMHEAPAAAVKAKPDSSIAVGLGLHRDGKASAFVSAGNTGAVMAASLFLLGRQAGVARPAVVGFFPSPKGVSLVLDVGTNVDCKPEHLVQFAHMGTEYMRRVMNREHPSVGLLNVGEEPGKGNELAKSAYPLLEAEAGITFTGNVEGRDILLGKTDVIVCDGFVGNVLLKFGESVAAVLPTMLGAAIHKSNIAPEEAAGMKQVFGGIKKQFDYEEFGGAPLLGVNGTVFIGHGGSSARAIENMILMAAKAAETDLPGAISRSLSA